MALLVVWWPTTALNAILFNSGDTLCRWQGHCTIKLKLSYTTQSKFPLSILATLCAADQLVGFCFLTLVPELHSTYKPCITSFVQEYCTSIVPQH